MTATPKELLAIADMFDDDARGHSGFPSQHMRKVAEWIRATVRADDDEPITLEWLQQSRLHGTIDGLFRYLLPGSDFCVEWFSGDTCELIIGNSIIPNIDSRGQFRTLCRVLGITLPEVPA